MRIAISLLLLHLIQVCLIRVSHFSLNISPQQYLWPVGGGTENEDCYKFAIASSDSGMSYKSVPKNATLLFLYMSAVK